MSGKNRQQFRPQADFLLVFGRCLHVAKNEVFEETQKNITFLVKV